VPRSGWFGGDAGGLELSAMLRELRPALQDGQWVFITAEEIPTGVMPLATFAEQEGLSLLLRREQPTVSGWRTTSWARGSA